MWSYKVLEKFRETFQLNLSVTRTHYAPTMLFSSCWIRKLEIQSLCTNMVIYSLSGAFAWWQSVFKAGTLFLEPRADEHFHFTLSTFERVARLSIKVRLIDFGGCAELLTLGRRLRACKWRMNIHTHKVYIHSVCASVDEREMYTCTHTTYTLVSHAKAEHAAR